MTDCIAKWKDVRSSGKGKAARHVEKRVLLYKDKRVEQVNQVRSGGRSGDTQKSRHNPNILCLGWPDMVA